MAAILEPRPYPLAAARRPAGPTCACAPCAVAGRPGRRPPRRRGLASPPSVAVLSLVVLAMVLAVAVGRGAFAGLAAGARPPPRRPAPRGRRHRSSVVVEPGDTLWSIARRLQPTGDVRALVDRLAGAAQRVGRPSPPGDALGGGPADRVAPAAGRRPPVALARRGPRG